MVSAAAKRALEKLWTDTCTVYQRQKVTDPETHLTDFQETAILTDQPCKLSFKTLAAAQGDPAAVVSQEVKLFLSPDVTIPAGCKIVVTRPNETERELVFTSSGLAGMYHNHQEISLVPDERWA